MKCKDCRYYKPMRPDPTIHVCKNKNSKWYVVEPDKDKCKHFEEVLDGDKETIESDPGEVLGLHK